MNVYKKREEILKANEGSKLTYDSKAKDITTIGNTTFVAPFPKYPTPHPIKIWSIILYNAFTTIDIIHGIANFLSSFPIFSVPKFICSICYFSFLLFKI